MPAFYAHDRFGKKVCNQLDGDIKDIVKKHYPQFQIGLQGPDIFFFYRLYSNNEVSNYGTNMHSISAYPFFLEALKVVEKKGRDSKEYAYLIGFICHYILDSECHPYIESIVRKKGLAHMEIEEEFEKKLLRIDKRDALAYPIADLVPTDRNTVQAIEPFHTVIDAKRIKISLLYLKALKRLFTAPGFFKQSLINTILKMLGKYEEMKGVMNQRIDNPKCEESNLELLRHFEESISLTVKMIYSFDESLQKGKELDERFNRTFE